MLLITKKQGIQSLLWNSHDDVSEGEVLEINMKKSVQSMAPSVHRALILIDLMKTQKKSLLTG